VGTSRAFRGKQLSPQIPHVRGKAKDLNFSNPSIEELSKNQDANYFSCPPHGTASSYAIPLLECRKKVIDLSADFRLNSQDCYEEFYGSPTLLLIG
jgi:N-acetyl-gamma-glutamyl-phosphate reductase